MNAANDSTIKIRNQTQNQFWLEFENQFLVLPDQKSVIGPDGSDPKKLMMEDITQGNPRQIGTHVSVIQTVLFDNQTQSLLVGDNKGDVKQSKMENGSFTKVKNYKKVCEGSIFSSTQVGRFAIFGGKGNSLVVIDISGQQVCPIDQKSPFFYTYSLQVCKGLGSNVYLSLGGRLCDYSLDTSDCLDVTLLNIDYNLNKTKLPKKVKQSNALIVEKDKFINYLSVKIKQLESSLEKQKKENTGMTNPQKSWRKTMN